MANSERKQPVSINLDGDLQQRLNVLSASRGRSVHWLIRQAIENYVEQEEQADALRRETLERWEEVETGQTTDNAAVVNWLKSWGSVDAKDQPL